MKMFASEYVKDYRTYSFGYTNYCVAESRAELPDVYDKGFLPYSANTDLRHDVFYMARSLRVSLDLFKDSSENKRLIRKIDDLNPQMEVVAKAEVDYHHRDFLHFCLDYAGQRFSNRAMDERRFLYVLSKTLGSHFLKFTTGDTIIGYVYTIVEYPIIHYWYSFFDISYLKTYSLGKYMLWSAIRWAKDQGFDYIYLGTCYGTPSLYKVRDFHGIQFWDGTTWNGDKNLLKALCKTDDQPKTLDVFKGLERPNEYLDEMLSS